MRYRPIVLAAACSAAALPVAAQSAARPMTFGDVLRIASLGAAELSPDGRWLAYEAARVAFPGWERRSDLYLASADGRTTRRLTYTEDASETEPRWHPRGGVIGFTSTREGDKRQLFLIHPDGGEARRVTRAEDGVTAWAWSPDGGRLAYLAGPEGRRQIWLLAGDGSGTPEPLTRHSTGVDGFRWAEDGRAVYFTAPDQADSLTRRRNRERFDVRVMDEPRPAVHLWAAAPGDTAARRLTQGDFRIVGVVELSRDGRWAAFRAAPTDRYADSRASEVYLLDLRGGAPQRLTDNYVSEGGLSFSPDSRLLAMTADRGFTFGSVSRVYVRPVGAAGAWRELPGDWDHDAGVEFWSPDSRTIHFDAQVGASRNLYALDVASGAVRALTRLTASVSARRAGDLPVALVQYADPHHPEDLYLAPLAALGRRERWVRLTALNPWVDSLRLARYETVRWRSSDGATVEGILVHPLALEPGRRAPLIVQLHGGPASAAVNGFSGGHGTYAHVLAGLGYAVLQPNYRGSTGYGEAFQTAISGDYWPLAFQDIMTGVDTVIGRGVAHPDSLGMMGWSAGGHWSNWTLVSTDRFKAISSGAGVANWISLYAQTDVQATREYYLGGSAGRDGANKPWDAYDHWWQESPLRHIARARTPTLIHFGERDQRIPMPQGLELHMALKKLGVPTEFLVYPGQPHGLREPRYQLVKMLAEVGWFERWIRGKPGWLDWAELLRMADQIAGGTPQMADGGEAR